MNQPQQLELIIRVTPKGVQVSGPIHDKMTCYALLECARDAIKEHVDKMNRSALVQARHVDPMLITRRQNGDANGS